MLLDWDSLLRFLGGIAGITAFLTFVGRRAVDVFLQSRIEKYKSDLERLAAEHSIRFRRLDAERAEVIKSLYQKLVTLDHCLQSALRFFQSSTEEPLEKKLTRLSNAYNALDACYRSNRIFFEPDTCALMNELMEGARGIFLNITARPANTRDPQHPFHRDILLERHYFWQEARTTYRIDIARLQKSLETRFRELLGIDV